MTKARALKLVANRERDIAETRKRMALANVEWDSRTAIGSRAYDVQNLGHTYRARVSHFEGCLKRTVERTRPRLVAWVRFDWHCYAIFGGLIGSPSFEASVDGTGSEPIPIMRAQARREDLALKSRLGGYFHSLCVDVIFYQRQFKEIGSLYGGDRLAAENFRLALDDLAEYYCKH